MIIGRRRCWTLLLMPACLAVLFLFQTSSYSTVRRRQSDKEAAQTAANAAKDEEKQQQLLGRIGSLQDRLRHAERQLIDLHQLLNEARPKNISNDEHLSTPSENRRRIVESDSAAKLVFPGALSHLPHLANRTSSALRPRRLLSRRAASDKPVELVIGVPTVKRQERNYLDETLRSLTSNLFGGDAKQLVIVVFVAEINDTAWSDALFDSVERDFGTWIESGVLELVAPSPDFYPHFDQYEPTLGDPAERMKWRSKQSLDFAYLMSYASSKGIYYMQLEDDVITKPHYVKAIQRCIRQQSQRHWLMLEFSYLGFIGKLFRASDLPSLVEFFVMFFTDKPVDWLLTNFLIVKACTLGTEKKCAKSLRTVSVRFKPSLFQHIGTQSSLAGKVQKLRDRDFGDKAKGGGADKPSRQLVAHKDNVKALRVHSSLKPYKRHTAGSAYAGTDTFWALNPQPGDHVTIELAQATPLERIVVRSGDLDHPSDLFYDAILEVHYAGDGARTGSSNETSRDGYAALGALKDGEINYLFGTAGSAAAVVPRAVDAVRVRVQKESAFWVLVREFWVKPYYPVTPRATTTRPAPVSAVINPVAGKTKARSREQ